MEFAIKKRYREIKDFLKDPHGIDRDWHSFQALSDSELLTKLNYLLRCKPKSARLRHLCHYITAMWKTEHQDKNER